MIDEKDIKVGLMFRLYRADKSTIVADRIENKDIAIEDFVDYVLVEIRTGERVCICKRIGNNDNEYRLGISRISEYGETLPAEDLWGGYSQEEKLEFDASLYEMALSEKSSYKIENNEQVNHPSHYTWLKDLCGVEPLDICRHLDFNIGNSLKYLLRKDKVDGDKTKTEKCVEDLRKAIFYIEDEIKLLENGKD